jgi:transposase
VLEPEIARAKAGESVLLFMDGAHFVQSAFLGRLWCFARIFIRSPSGRKRWNVLGAYNAISGQLTTVANDGYITATTVCEMLRKLSVQYAGRPIVIVLDNARYQHCKLVEGLALELGITLQFLPSYSPNLNLIERLWKFVKKKCLYNIYYATFDEFMSGINDCLSLVETDYKFEIATLMQPNFQDLKNANLLAL